MDFELGEEEQAIRDLTAQVLDDMSSHERLKALAADGDHVDCKAWAALAGDRGGGRVGARGSMAVWDSASWPPQSRWRRSVGGRLRCRCLQRQ